MRADVKIAFGTFLLAILVMGAVVWLANNHLQPALQTSHVIIPDERLPH